MSRVSRCAVDTLVLQKANAPLIAAPKARRLFAKRVALLSRIQRGELVVLLSRRLLDEYTRHVPEPRNVYTAAFLDLLARPGGCLWNWYRPWSTAVQDRARRCRYPKHDDHVLRTAAGTERAFLFTEENPLLKTAECIRSAFNVDIRLPW